MAITAQSELMIQRAQLIIIRIKGAALNQRMLEIPGNITHNTGIYVLIIGKMMTRVICSDHKTTATTPFPNQ